MTNKHSSSRYSFTRSGAFTAKCISRLIASPQLRNLKMTKPENIAALSATRAPSKISALVAAGLLSFISTASAQVELRTYADANGYIDVQKLTCGQLANTFQEDADFLGIWYSGWYNGLGKKHAVNVPRVKEGIHNVIVYCKANQDKRIIQAIDVILKREQQQKR